MFKEDPHKRLEREDDISPDCYEMTDKIVSRAIKKLKSRYYAEILPHYDRSYLLCLKT